LSDSVVLQSALLQDIGMINDAWQWYLKYTVIDLPKIRREWNRQRKKYENERPDFVGWHISLSSGRAESIAEEMERLWIHE
jgi:hypothetical protein